MWKNTQHLRTSALPAIAAALALSSTPVFAQEAQPVPTDPAPVASEPATPPTTDATPAPAEASPAPAAPDTTTATDAAGTSSATKTSTHVRTTKHAAVSKPVKATTRTVTRTASTHVAAPVAAAAPAPRAVPTAPAPTTATNSGSAVSPVVDMNAQPAPQTAATTAKPAAKHDNTVPIAAGGALALLAIGGAAVAMNRRRHEEEEEWVEEDSYDHEPEVMTEEDSHDHEPEVMADEPIEETRVHEEQPTILAPPVSAFSWGNETRATESAEEPKVEQDDREPGETWVERAYRGPSPLNPSVSLKTRLRRAAFFDKRERDAAAGLAAPIDPTAGLPDRLVEQRESELA